MTYDEAVAEALTQGSYVKAIIPRANWIELHGMFTPEQLRAIATEIERRWNRNKREPAS